ncbi:hypothetical protein OQA88_8871 [Cercophora sp. LCS_1]
MSTAVTGASGSGGRRPSGNGGDDRRPKDNRRSDFPPGASGSRTGANQKGKKRAVSSEHENERASKASKESNASVAKVLEALDIQEGGNHYEAAFYEAGVHEPVPGWWYASRGFEWVPEENRWRFYKLEDERRTILNPYLREEYDMVYDHPADPQRTSWRVEMSPGRDYPRASSHPMPMAIRAFAQYSALARHGINPREQGPLSRPEYASLARHGMRVPEHGRLMTPPPAPPGSPGFIPLASPSNSEGNNSGSARSGSSRRPVASPSNSEVTSSGSAPPGSARRPVVVSSGSSRASADNREGSPSTPTPTPGPARKSGNAKKDHRR